MGPHSTPPESEPLRNGGGGSQKSVPLTHNPGDPDDLGPRQGEEQKKGCEMGRGGEILPGFVSKR